MRPRFYFLFLCCLLSGCAGTSYLAAPEADTSGRPGVYHRVEPAQTLWRISKIYGVDIEELAKVNRILDTSSLEVGQSLFIPRQQHAGVRQSAVNLGDDFSWPIKGRVICAYGQTYNNMVNKGINIEPYSLLDVASSRSGRVVFIADNFAGLGKTIVIDHGDGFLTVYGNNAEILVKAGESVNKGAVISRLASSGRQARYLHFEIRKGHLSQNPNFYLAR